MPIRTALSPRDCLAIATATAMLYGCVRSNT
jgi:hypothetical protein